jgi:hypothetical protein
MRESTTRHELTFVFGAGAPKAVTQGLFYAPFRSSESSRSSQKAIGHAAGDSPLSGR